MRLPSRLAGTSYRDASLSVRSYVAEADSYDLGYIRQRAEYDGVDALIGPLFKPAVATMARSGYSQVPVIALNYLPRGTLAPSNFFQFGLLPEDEGYEIARKALDDGHRTAAVLVPDDDWGARMAYAFRRAFSHYGGQVINETGYPRRSDDLKSKIAEFLGAGTSDPLWRDRRSHQYIDVVLLAASPRDARLIKPLMRFHKAGKLPVYATSKIYTGTPDPRRDADLNGVVFCDMPWLLPAGPEQPAPSQVLALSDPKIESLSPRLVALGMDAAMLARRLPELLANPTGSLNGVTGRLRLLPNNHIYRELTCARFNNGLPERL